MNLGTIINEELNIFISKLQEKEELEENDMKI